MQRRFRLAVIVVALGLLPLGAGALEPKEEATIRAKLASGSTITGQLTAVSVEGDEPTWTVKVTYTTKVMDKDVKTKLDDLAKQYQTALQRRDKNGVQRITGEIQKAQPTLYKNEDTPFEFNCKGDKNLKIRRLELPPKTDDAGKTVAYTPGEKLKLRGEGADANLPGFAATAKNLETDLYVKVTIDRSKIKPAKKDEAKDETLPCTMIMIVPAPKDPMDKGKKTN